MSKAETSNHIVICKSLAHILAEHFIKMLDLTVSGIPTYFLASLLDMASWGGTGAEALKNGIDSIFTSDGKIPCLVSFTADGASVNLGRISGMLTRMSQDCEWLLKIHCTNHRVELAVKKAFQDSKFRAVDTFSQENFNLKNSGKVSGIVKASASALGIQYQKMSKITGTRFIGHRASAFKKLLDMWPAFTEGYENIIANASSQASKAKVEGLLKKFQSFKFLTLSR